MGPILHHTAAERHACPHSLCQWDPFYTTLQQNATPRHMTQYTTTRLALGFERPVHHPGSPQNGVNIEQYQATRCRTYHATQHPMMQYAGISYIIVIIIMNIYPLTARVAEAPQMISQPVSSIFPVLHCPLGLWQTPGMSIPLCCFPTSFSVCLIFFLLSLCLARWLWPDLMNRRHNHTTAVCVSLRWSGGLRVVRLPAGSWHGLPRWKSMQ